MDPRGFAKALLWKTTWAKDVAGVMWITKSTTTKVIASHSPPGPTPTKEAKSVETLQEAEARTTHRPQR